MSIPAPNYTQVPNAILDQIHELSGSQVKVILLFCRETFGFHRQRTKQMGVAAIAKKTGLSRQSVMTAIDFLAEEMNWVVRIPVRDSYNYEINLEEVVKKFDQSKNLTTQSKNLTTQSKNLTTDEEESVKKFDHSINKEISLKEKERKKGDLAPKTEFNATENYESGVNSRKNQGKVDYERFRQIWNEHRNDRCSEMTTVNAKRQKVFNELIKEWGGYEAAIENFENSVKYLAKLTWYSGKPLLTFENFATNNKIVSYAEAWGSENSCTSSDSEESLKQIREELRQQLEELLSQGKIQKIYTTEGGELRAITRGGNHKQQAHLPALIRRLRSED